MGTGAYRHLGKYTFGGKGYPKCPVPIFSKCLQIGTGENGHLGHMNIWGKGVPKCPLPIFPKCLQMGTGGKWAFGEKGHPKYPVPIFPNAHMQTFGEVDTGHLGRLPN